MSKKRILVPLLVIFLLLAVFVTVALARSYYITSGTYTDSGFSRNLSACGPFGGPGEIADNKCQGAQFNNGEYIYHVFASPPEPGCAPGMDWRIEYKMWFPLSYHSAFEDWVVTVGYGDVHNNWYVCEVPYDVGARPEGSCEFEGNPSLGTHWRVLGLGAWRNGSEANYVPVGTIDYLRLKCLD